jgi:hypothetical protein
MCGMSLFVGRKVGLGARSGYCSAGGGWATGGGVFSH